jgi:hypothetical protein
MLDSLLFYFRPTKQSNAVRVKPFDGSADRLERFRLMRLDDYAYALH